MWKMFLAAVLGLWITGAILGQETEGELHPSRSLADEYAANRPFTWWRLDNPGEDTAYDTMSRYDGVKKNLQGRFDGQESRIELGPVDVDSDKISILAWFRAEDFATADARIISKAVGANDADHYWMLSTIKEAGEIRLRCRLKLNGITKVLIADKGDLEIGKWVFAAVVYDGNQIRLFQNGEVVGSMDAMGKVATNSHAHAWIGANPYDGGGKFFHGQIKDVALFKNAISEQSIKVIFRAKVAIEDRIKETVASSEKRVVTRIQDTIAERADGVEEKIDETAELIEAKIADSEANLEETIATGDENVVKGIVEAIGKSTNHIIDAVEKSDEGVVSRIKETVGKSADSVKSTIQDGDNLIVNRMESTIGNSARYLRKSIETEADCIRKRIEDSERRLLDRIEDTIASCEKRYANMLPLEPALPAIFETVNAPEVCEGGICNDAEMADQFVNSSSINAAPTLQLVNEEFAAFNRLSVGLSSDDMPSFWTAIPYGPLSVRIKFAVGPNAAAAADYIQLIMDGEPLNNNRVELVTPAMPELTQDGRMWMSYSYSVECPPLGKHVLQARYLRDNVWSKLSSPLRFDVRLPTTPEVISVSDSRRGSVPAQDSLIKIRRDELYVKLGRVQSTDLAILYVDGAEVDAERIEDCCVRFENIGNYLSPGIHSLTFCVTPRGTACSLTSKPSKEVLVHYFNESAYIFKCNADCKSTPCRESGDEPCDRSQTDEPSIDDSQMPLPPPNRSQPTPELLSNEIEAIDETGEFVFASSAYFPIRDFGPRGEVIDRDGAVIYEDMVFAFNTRTGDYTVHFDMSYPQVPTTIRLRFLVRPKNTGRWYTITLKPFHIKPECEKNGECGDGCKGTCQGASHKCKITGNSHVLRICGENICSGDIRREGSARFGFGLSGLGQSRSE